MMDTKVTNLQPSLVSIKTDTSGIVKPTLAQPADASVMQIISTFKIDIASELTSETIQVYQSFDDAQQQLQQLQAQSEPWTSKWLRLSQVSFALPSSLFYKPSDPPHCKGYVDTTKKALEVGKMGNVHFSGNIHLSAIILLETHECHIL